MAPDPASGPDEPVDRHSLATATDNPKRRRVMKINGFKTRDELEPSVPEEVANILTMTKSECCGAFEGSLQDLRHNHSQKAVSALVKRVHAHIEASTTEGDLDEKGYRLMTDVHNLQVFLLDMDANNLQSTFCQILEELEQCLGIKWKGPETAMEQAKKYRILALQSSRS
ncbi:hypothetical protein LTR56_003301 [Elasticomyces elasticus]|nr:hypothetical protein LTR56_003301 [Elasticomyces elasticus]KAK3664281.1 hypothetical protein LTR22_004979 [Elasticomyces elasticus]KAK4931497.1 hypothetical protein LTR49_002198 [Elasticomyces elasticus]KAK5765984.1 hypothetical protein LTS12_003730 [Elasticomyces elasticus]